MAGLRGILSNPTLSVVMPVYNERDTIEEIIPRVLAVPLRDVRHWFTTRIIGFSGVTFTEHA